MKNEKLELQSILRYLNENVHSSPSGSSFDDLFYELSQREIITYKGQLQRSINHLLKDGFIEKESNDWYNITTAGILFINEGGYLSNNRQKLIRWYKKDENIRWYISSIIVIIIAILGWIFKP